CSQERSLVLNTSLPYISIDDDFSLNLSLTALIIES
ncbi:hypothetical protein GTA07_14645, partial [Rhodococcus hoagii]|nr:hypothetical protein [Prescottella equi]